MISPLSSSTVKCDAPGALGTITSVVALSARTLICAGLPTSTLDALRDRRRSSDLSGVRRRGSALVCKGALLPCVIEIVFANAFGVIEAHASASVIIDFKMCAVMCPIPLIGFSLLLSYREKVNDFLILGAI